MALKNFQFNRNDLIQESSKYKYSFRNVPTIRSFGDSLFNGKITISEAGKQQSNLLKAILQRNDKVDQDQKQIRMKNKYL